MRPGKKLGKSAIVVTHRCRSWLVGSPRMAKAGAGRHVWLLPAVIVGLHGHGFSCWSVGHRPASKMHGQRPWVPRVLGVFGRFLQSVERGLRRSSRSVTAAMFIAIEKVSLDDWLERLLRAQLIANSWVARLAGTSFTFIWTGGRVPDRSAGRTDGSVGHRCSLAAPGRGQQSG
jgi:hypothetical protein